MARKIGLFVLALTMVGVMCGAALAGDTLADVKKKGVLVAGVKDSLPPFGSVDPNTKEFVGYDIDFVKYIAKKLGVKVEYKPVSSANRMPMLMESRDRPHRRDDDEEPGTGQADRLQLHLLPDRPEVPDEEGDGQEPEGPRGAEDRDGEGLHLGAERGEGGPFGHGPLLRRLSPGGPGAAAGEGHRRDHGRVDPGRPARQAREEPRHQGAVRDPGHPDLGGAVRPRDAEGRHELREVRQRHDPRDGEERRGGEDLREVVRPELGQPDQPRQFQDHRRQDEGPE